MRPSSITLSIAVIVCLIKDGIAFTPFGNSHKACISSLSTSQPTYIEVVNGCSTTAVDPKRRSIPHSLTFTKIRHGKVEKKRSHIVLSSTPGDDNDDTITKKEDEEEEERFSAFVCTNKIDSKIEKVDISSYFAPHYTQRPDPPGDYSPQNEERFPSFLSDPTSPHTPCSAPPIMLKRNHNTTDETFNTPKRNNLISFGVEPTFQENNIAEDDDTSPFSSPSSAVRKREEERFCSFLTLPSLSVDNDYKRDRDILSYLNKTKNTTATTTIRKKNNIKKKKEMRRISTKEKKKMVSSVPWSSPPPSPSSRNPMTSTKQSMPISPKPIEKDICFEENEDVKETKSFSADSSPSSCSSSRDSSMSSHEKEDCFEEDEVVHKPEPLLAPLSPSSSVSSSDSSMSFLGKDSCFEEDDVFLKSKPLSSFSSASNSDGIRSSLAATAASGRFQQMEDFLDTIIEVSSASSTSTVPPPSTPRLFENFRHNGRDRNATIGTIGASSLESESATLESEKTNVPSKSCRPTPPFKQSTQNSEKVTLASVPKGKNTEKLSGVGIGKSSLATAAATDRSKSKRQQHHYLRTRRHHHLHPHQGCACCHLHSDDIECTFEPDISKSQRNVPGKKENLKDFSVYDRLTGSYVFTCGIAHSDKKDQGMEEVEQEQRAPEAKVLNKLNTFQQDEISSAIKRRNQFYSLQDDWTKRRDETQKKNTTENCEPDNISSAIKRRNQFNSLQDDWMKRKQSLKYLEKDATHKKRNCR
uniref:Uncharacterized protein n=1 Tax=Ditylum brightwellii TaxID=49249 RepID=A0A7S2ERH0_9STRA|mmetsp:Transcript_40816/g.61125  ORF Transcript_40816/g.61125 Transcript_40816/m.61125 type:complete len:754 (+) Transcript_40816:52-2313(+)